VYNKAETCRCVLYGNVHYIEMPSVNCCVLTACICMYIHIIHCNNILMPYIPLRFATLPTRVSYFHYSCCLTYLLKFKFNCSFHILALRNICTYVTNQQMHDKICSIIQYFLHLVFFSLCAFLGAVFVLRVLFMCICCTLCVLY
jgi:hypothetical protein